MQRDNPYLLDLLAIVFDPDNKFNTFNAARQPECFATLECIWGVLDSNKMFAKPRRNQRIHAVGLSIS